MEFREVNDQDVEMLHRAVREHDADRIAHTAHRMSGASRSIGADSLAMVCKRIETAARAQDLETVRLNMPAFQHEMARVNGYIDALPRVPETGS
jgi:HPt (histidine-containing phosphotransfer) domain-containing protein